MAVSKKGTSTGKKDCGCSPIRVGDRVVSINNGLRFRVDRFGRLKCESIPDITKLTWDGADYRIIEHARMVPAPLKPIEAEKKPVESTEETNDATARPCVTESTMEPVEGEKLKGMTEERVLRRMSLRYASDKDLADELRDRGYKVKCTKESAI